VPQARSAWAAVRAAYGYRLYAYLRRRGHSADLAQDLTRGFFASLRGRDFLAGIAPVKGKFRSFLLTSFPIGLSNQHDREHARNRRGRADARSARRGRRRDPRPLRGAFSRNPKKRV